MMFSFAINVTVGSCFTFKSYKEKRGIIASDPLQGKTFVHEVLCLSERSLTLTENPKYHLAVARLSQSVKLQEMRSQSPPSVPELRS